MQSGQQEASQFNKDALRIPQFMNYGYQHDIVIVQQRCWLRMPQFRNYGNRHDTVVQQRCSLKIPQFRNYGYQHDLVVNEDAHSGYDSSGTTDIMKTIAQDEAPRFVTCSYGVNFSKTNVS
jgi:hypothetical protein